MGVVTDAAAIAGVDRNTVYMPPWKGDAEFQAALKVAREMGEELRADMMVREVTRRSVHGVERPTGWHKGEPGAIIREYSDLLLMFGLKAIKPEYRDPVLPCLDPSADAVYPYQAVSEPATGSLPWRQPESRCRP